MTSYPKYKCSGIDWYQDVPIHWENSRLKFAMSDIIGGGTPNTGNHEYWVDENGFPWVAISDITGSEGKLSSTAKSISKKAIEETRLRIIPKGTLLISIFASLGKTTTLEIDATVNQAILGLVTDGSRLATAFLKYYLWFSENFISFYSSANTQENLNLTKIKNLPIYLPNVEEQTTIANYLDKKTTQIDKLIADKQKLIELLKEERTVIINEAVSGKGKNWEKKKLKYVAKLKSGEGITADDIRPEGEYAVYGGNGLRGFTSTYTHEGDYVLIGRQGALCGNINYATAKFFASEHAVVVSILDESEFIWLGELLRSMNLNQYSLASAQPGLSVERIQNLPIPFPPLKEQIRIVKQIQTETQRINNIISKIEKELELMQEYKTALISEVVTGKIKIIQ